MIFMKLIFRDLYELFLNGAESYRALLIRDLTSTLYAYRNGSLVTSELRDYRDAI